MKKIIYLIMIIIGFLFSSCTTDIATSVSSGVINSVSYAQSDSSISYDNEKSNDSNVLDNFYVNNDYIPIDFAFLANLNTFRIANENNLNTDLIISCISNNDQIVRRLDYGSQYGWDYEDLYNKITNKNDLVSVYAKDYYFSESTNYNTLDNEILFLTTDEVLYQMVLYKKYDINNQPSQNEWLEFFSSIIKNEIGDFYSPIIISESWEFKLDGCDAAVVTANNTLKNEDDCWYYDEDDCLITPIIIKEHTPIIYNITAFFCNGTTLLIKSPNIIQISNQQSPPDTQRYGPFYVPFFSYQYGDSCEIILQPIFGTSSGTNIVDSFLFNPSLLVADIDADCQTEIILFNDSNRRLNRYVEILKYRNNILDKYLAWGDF